MQNISSSIRYRVSQFISAVNANFLGFKKQHAKIHLYKERIHLILSTKEQQSLFQRMPQNDQYHAISVFETLINANYDNIELLQAALLHDVGKTIGIPISYRVLIVLLNAVLPKLYRSLSEKPAIDALSSPSSQCIYASIYNVNAFRRPFVVYRYHAFISACLAQEQGLSDRVINFIAKHHDIFLNHQEDTLLSALQWADQLN
ncbi:MAG: hypothetical protein HQK77_20595 [Desulfobacterales bacterium]|nr:hypothetical protein [Desulfobacterales bacterium]